MARVGPQRYKKKKFNNNNNNNNNKCAAVFVLHDVMYSFDRVVAQSPVP